MGQPSGAVSLSIQNMKGGAGKTTIASNIAYDLGLAGYHVLIIDMDDQGTMTETMDGANPKTGERLTRQDIYNLDLLSLYSVPVNTRDYICKTRYENIDLIPNSRNMDASSMFDVLFNEVMYENRRLTLEEKHMNFYKNIEQIREDYDYIIIDGKPGLSALTDLSIIISDYVVTPVEDDNYNLTTMMDVIERIRHIIKIYGNTYPVEFFGFFLNQTVEKDDFDRNLVNYYKSNFPEQYLEQNVRYSRPIGKKAAFNGKMFLEYNKRCLPGIDILKLLVYEFEMIDEEHLEFIYKSGVPKKLVEEG